MAKGPQLSRAFISLNLRDDASAGPTKRETPDCSRKTHRLVILVSFFVLALSSSTSFAQISPRTDSTITAIKALFENGSYTLAELQARRELEDKRVSPAARVQLEKYLGFTLVAEGRNDAAIEHFVNALRIDSSLTLDPVLTSPKILSVFETAREKYRLDIVRERAVGKPEEESPVQISRGPTFRAILFPGWEQLYRGRETKGYILLGAGAAAAISAITSDILRRSAYTRYMDAATPALAENRYNTYNFYYKTEFYSVSAFILIYLYSELDSFMQLPPHFSAGYSPSSRSLNLNFRVSF